MIDPTSDAYREYSKFYDLYVGDKSDDIPFYLEYARGAQTPILEIGAGTGRLTIPFARAGHSVVAVDVSPSMLAILDERLKEETSEIHARVQVVKADMRALALGTRFDVVIVPYFIFNYLMSRDDQRDALERLQAHMSPLACLLIDVFIPYRLIDDCPSEPVVVLDKIDPVTGDRVRGLVSFAVDTERQIESRRHVFEVKKSDGTVSESVFDSARRYSLPPELRDLFSQSGLSIEAELPDYGRSTDPVGESRLRVARAMILRLHPCVSSHLALARHAVYNHTAALGRVTTTFDWS